MRLALALFCLSVAAPVMAQADNPARVPAWDESHAEEGNRAVIILYRLATCAQRNRMEAAEAFLRTEPGSAAERTAAQALIVFSNLQERQPDWCLTGSRDAFRFRIRSMDALRGAVSESTYNGNGIRPKGEAALPTPATPVSARSRDVIACAVARNPMTAHRILQVNYGSPTETRYLRRFNADLLACLPPAGPLRVSRLGVRTYIAEALLKAARHHRELFINA